MKQTMIIAMLCIGMMCTAQTEVTPPQTIYKGINSLSVKMYEDSSYIIQYRNAKYTHVIDIDHISFPSKEDILSFIGSCHLVITDDKQFTHLDYHIFKSLGTCAVINKTKINSVFYLSKNQLTKIYNALNSNQ